MPIEVIEAASPIVIWRKELLPDSGGHGQYRGGLGQVVEVGARDDAGFEVLAMFERVDRPARGRQGGSAGSTGKVHRASGAAMRAKGLQPIPAGDRLILEIPGGAGFGDPKKREQALIDADVAAGFISKDVAQSIYAWPSKVG
jgi:N-methylhydantoinase B